MHEISVCRSILSTIESEMDEEDFVNVREIHLKIGVLSNIDAEILKHVFTFVKIGTLFQNAELNIDMVEITAECGNCVKIFKVEDYKFICPQCGEAVSNITKGQELLIHKIILEEPSHEEINQ